MGFHVVHPNNTQTQWVPVGVSDIARMGMIVCWDTATPGWGVKPIGTASGAANVTNLDIPWGVVVGTNAVSGDSVYTSTFGGTEQITALAETGSHNNTVQYQGVEGPTPHGEKCAMVEVALITAETVLRGPIFNAAWGTAPSAEVASAADTDGLDITLSTAQDVAPVAGFATMFCRTGANRGIYRILDTTGNTTPTNTIAFPYDIAANDTFVCVNGLRPWGRSYMQLDAEAIYINSGAALTSDYYEIDVVRLDLSTAGDEYVEFRFAAVNFISTDRSDNTA